MLEKWVPVFVQLSTLCAPVAVQLVPTCCVLFVCTCPDWVAVRWTRAGGNICSADFTYPSGCVVEGHDVLIKLFTNAGITQQHRFIMGEAIVIYISTPVFPYMFTDRLVISKALVTVHTSKGLLGARLVFYMFL